MVGRSWSDEEERYFWRHVVPYSHSRGGIFVATNKEVTWDDLAIRMANHFGRDARREYSHPVLCKYQCLMPTSLPLILDLASFIHILTAL